MAWGFKLSQTDWCLLSSKQSGYFIFLPLLTLLYSCNENNTVPVNSFPHLFCIVTSRSLVDFRKIPVVLHNQTNKRKKMPLAIDPFLYYWNPDYLYNTLFSYILVIFFHSNTYTRSCISFLFIFKE